MDKSIKIRDIVFWGIVIAFALSFIKSCKGNFLGGLFSGKRTDTLSVRSDTVWAIYQGDTTYIPITHTVTNTIHKTVYRTDTLESFEILPTDTAAILERFYQKVAYSDSLEKRDTSIKKFGSIVVYDSVHGNRIISRRLVTNLKIPEVTNTVTVERKRNVVYIGATMIGTPTNPLYAAGGELSLKSKVNDKIYSIGAFTTKAGEIYYQAGLKVPIRLTKK